MEGFGDSFVAGAGDFAAVDAVVVGAGAVDAGVADAGVVDAGAVDAVVEGGVFADVATVAAVAVAVLV